MEKEVAKQELKQNIPSQPPKPSLSPDVLAAIQEAVSAAVGQVVAALKPVQPEAPKVDGIGAPAVPSRVPYVSKLKGIEVEPGQDLRHVHPERIRQWFTQQEIKWKAAYNQRQIDGKAVNVGWTRG